jgi:hypothetical protein
MSVLATAILGREVKRRAAKFSRIGFRLKSRSRHAGGPTKGNQNSSALDRQERGVTLMGADLDESAMAYRRPPDVIAQHAGTVKVLPKLRPLAVAMAGAGEGLTA